MAVFMLLLVRVVPMITGESDAPSRTDASDAAAIRPMSTGESDAPTDIEATARDFPYRCFCLSLLSFKQIAHVVYCEAHRTQNKLEQLGRQPSDFCKSNGLARTSQGNPAQLMGGISALFLRESRLFAC